MTSKNPVLHAPSVVRAWIPAAYATALFVTLFTLGRAYDRQHQREVLALLAVGVVLVACAWVQQRAELGAEAIALSWVFRLGNIRYADIRRAVPHGRKTVTIETTDGRSLVLSAGYLDEAVARDVLERLWKALAAGAQEGSRGVERETLARSGRPTAEWRRALRELGAPGGYRSAQLSHDRLLAIAENPGITTDVRTAAVVALSGGELAPATRDRLEKIAGVTVDPRLRDVLEKMATLPGLSEHDCDAALDAI